MSSQCPHCGIYGGATAAHVCITKHYEEFPRMTAEDIALEAEARRLGIHPIELMRRKNAERVEAERRAAEAELDLLCLKWGMTP